MTFPKAAVLVGVKVTWSQFSRKWEEKMSDSGYGGLFQEILL